MSSPLDLPAKIPLEDWEQRQVVLFCVDNTLPHFRVPNETYTESKVQMRKNKLLGVSAGVPDMFVVVGTIFIGIEMKRRREAKPSVSKSQKVWHEILNGAGVPTYVCYGHQEAIDLIIDTAARQGIELENPADNPF